MQLFRSFDTLDRWRLVARKWPALLLLALFLANAAADALRNTGTCDELGAHIPSGWLYWKSGVFSGGIDNFPLGQLILTAPAALLCHDYALWTEQHLFLFRLPGILLGLGLCLLVWRFAIRMHGRAAGLAALFFASLCPNLLAHSTVATLDLPVAFFIFLVIFLLDRCVEKPGPWRVALLALALGAGALVKVQALVLYPYILLVLLLLVFPLGRPFLSPRPGQAAGSGAPGSGPARGRFVASWLFLPLIWIVLVAIVYRHVPGQEGAFLPPLFLRVLSGLFFHAEQGHFAYLLGQYSNTGWWYYFPVVILVKTPIAELVLAGFGLARRQSRREFLLATAPMVLFLALAMAGNINIGVRHILMIYPFLAVAAGRGMVRLWDLGKAGQHGSDLRADPASRRGRAGSHAAPARRASWPSWPRLVLTGMLAAVVVQAVAIAPHHLSYFNLLAGGTRNGHRVLIDSNYDWGQNDRFLRSYVERRGLPYRINPYAFWPVNGPILVNANAMYGVLNGGTKAYSWLRRFQPVHRVAYSWFEFDVPAGTFKEQRDDDEARQQCLAHLFRIREAARIVPGPVLHAVLAHAFANFGAYDVAFAELRESMRLDPRFDDGLNMGGDLIVCWKLGALVFHGREYLDGFRTDRPAIEDNEERLVALAQRGGMAATLAEFEIQLGATLEARGDPQNARDAYRLAVRLLPASPEARSALQRLGGMQ